MSCSKAAGKKRTKKVTLLFFIRCSMELIAMIYNNQVKLSRFAHLEKFSPNFSSSSFVSTSILSKTIYVSLSLILSLQCFAISVSYYLQITINLKVILYVAKTTQNFVAELLQKKIIINWYGVVNVKGMLTWVNTTTGNKYNKIKLKVTSLKVA